MSSPFPNTTIATPTTASYIIATAIVAGVTGYFIGQGSSLGIFGTDVSPSKKHGSIATRKEIGEDSESESDGSDEEENQEGVLATFEGNTEEVKLVLVVRTDLGMGKGSP
jgi:hypothetical protein